MPSRTTTAAAAAARVEAAAKPGATRDARWRMPARALPLLFNALLAGLCLLPRIHNSPPLLLAVMGSSGALLLLTGIVFYRLAQTGRTPAYQFVPRPVHYVQAMMHSSIYIYWGLYWPQVRLEVPLLIAQMLLVVVLDMLVCWLRRDTWVLGFGPIPIVLSTNLFLFFRDDWFYLQFLMLAGAVLGKEFVRWKRDGRSVHIFNPSAFPLFVISILLLATGSTSLSWGPQISETLHLPPHIYLEVFILGLIVQALFSVTLVTLASGAALYALNLVYTHHTGLYHFIDSNIPISVFIGLHLLVTDPATSPRSAKAKFVFGALYGAGVYGLYSVLGWMQCPQFYDKLLCVMPLNLAVRGLDRLDAAAGRVLARLRLPEFRSWSPRRLNYAHMSVWIGLYAVMAATAFVGPKHPGQDPEFWHRACGQHRGNACEVWVRTLHVNCQANSARDCLALGEALQAHLAAAPDQAETPKSLGRACDLGLGTACVELAGYAQSGQGRTVLQRACERGDGATCFIFGSLLHLGRGMAHDDVRALTMFTRACQAGWPRGCARLGESYALGEGTGRDPVRALALFEQACAQQYGAGCMNAGLMYRRGVNGHANSAAARVRFRQACELGIREACQ